MALPNITAGSRVVWHQDSAWNPFDNGYYTVNGKRISHDELTKLADQDPDAYREYITELNRAADRAQATPEQVQSRAERARSEGPNDEPDAADATDWMMSFITQEAGDLESQLASAGANLEAEEVQRFLREFDSFEEDIPPEAVGALISNIAQKYPGASASAYQQALQAGGFEEEFRQVHSTDEGEIRTGRGHYRPEIAESTGPQLETSGDLMRFKNGVIVDQTTGQVLYEPGSTVPGSPGWRNHIAKTWGPEKAQEWRKRLYDLGYDVEKKGGMDVQLLSALGEYWNNRYVMGGEVVPVVAGGRASLEEKAKLVNVREEFGASIRNDLRETYRRIYGTDPTDGEIEALSSTVFDTAMKLQRQYRGKYGDPNTSAAIQEAGERTVERIEGSPQARLLNESEEENTRLRDSLETAIAATRGLAG